MSVIIYGDMKNRAGRIIWALEELGVPYEARGVKLMRGEQRSEAFLALNPKGKVPVCLIPIKPKAESSSDDDAQSEIERVAVTESVGILYALAERFDGSCPTLLPQSWQSRVRCHEWLAFGETELEPPVWTHAKHSFVYPEKRRIPEIFPSCAYDFTRALKHLESELSDGRDWLCGEGDEAFSIADIFIAHTLMWSQTRGFEINGVYTNAYLKRALARPAWRRALSSGD